ncbi:MAG TPA: porin [Paracoccaceae bacterium]|nr:porin [Paracoccaceae bacterium]HMO70836.1 porin [Paracoccaceae bacterium]
MKKLLIATTALVATAGVAAADVKVSGNGRMGIVYNGADLNFSSRVRVAFTLSGETDGGLSFGGSIRADNAGGGANGSAGEIFISGAFGKLAMGDVVGAAEQVVGNLPEIGFQDISGGGNDMTYITGDGALTAANNPVALYTYTTGGLTFALSMNDGKVSNGSTPDTQEYAVGVKYSFGDFSVALGYEVADPVAGASSKHLILGGSAKFGTTTVNAIIGDGSGAISGFKQYGLGVTSTFDAITVKAFAKRTEVGTTKVSDYGIGAAYSLGGGATVEGGFAKTTGTKTRADLGLKFTF